MALNLHHNHYHLLQMGELGRVFYAHTLLVLSSSLVAVFVPIFLLKLGYNLTSVLAFLAAQGVVSLLAQPAVMRIITRRGANRVMAAGVILQVLLLGYLMILPELGHHVGLLFVASALWALHTTTYYPSFHANFSKAKHHERSTKEVGAVQIIVTMAKGLAPAVGGIVASAFGINWVYGVALILVVLAVMPLLTAPEITVRRPARLKSLDWRKIRPDLISDLGNGITTQAETIVWPLLVFYIVSSYAGVGILSSVVALSSIAAALYVSFRSAKSGAHHYITQGVSLASLSDAFRMVAQNAGQVFGINLLGGVGNSLYYTPWFSRFYTHADEEPRIEYVTAMEMANEAARVVVFVPLLLLSVFFDHTVVLLVGIAMSIPANFMIRRIR